MDELKQYVDNLFSHQKSSARTNDLKDEIYSNMAAKKSDLLEQGMSEKEAIEKAKASVASIDSIIGDDQLTYINKYKSYRRQSLLLAAVIVWVMSIPTMLVGVKFFSAAAFLLVILFGVMYLRSLKNDRSDVAFVNKQDCRRQIKTVWFVWLFFFLFCSAVVSAVIFASNFWFARPFTITGPYQFATIAARYYLPLTTVAFPIAVTRFSQLLRNSERADADE